MFPSIDPNQAKEELTCYGTPGTVLYINLETEGDYTSIRGLHVMDGKLYAVCGNTVYRISVSGTTVSKATVGTIDTSSGDVFMASNMRPNDADGSQLLIVDGSEFAYYIYPNNTITKVTDASFPTYPNCVTYQDGYHIVSKKDTDEIYWSQNLNDVTAWDATDTSTVDAQPGKIQRIISGNRELWIFKEFNTQVFYNSGDANELFKQIQGAVLEVGTIAPSSVARCIGSFYWLTDSLRIAKNNGYQVQIISTPTLDYQLSKYITTSDAIGFYTIVEGHDWYVITFPTDNVTWVYDISTGFWFEWESYDANDVSDPWGRHRANCAITFDNKQIIGDYENGNLYYLDMDTYVDGNDEEIRRYRTSQFIVNDRKNIVFHTLEVEFESGVGLAGYEFDLTVCIPPEVLTNPSNASVDEGESATFTMTGAASGTPTYQWYFGWDDGL